MMIIAFNTNIVDVQCTQDRNTRWLAWRKVNFILIFREKANHAAAAAGGGLSRVAAAAQCCPKFHRAPVYFTLWATIYLRRVAVESTNATPSPGWVCDVLT